MKCPGCGGNVVYEEIFEIEMGSLEGQWRCIHCGDRFYEGKPQLVRRRTLKLTRKEASNENLCGG